MNKTQEALKMAMRFAKSNILTRISGLHGENPLTGQEVFDACKEALEQPLTRDWKETIDERIAKDDEFKEALAQPAQEPVALLEALSDLEHQQWMKWAKSIIYSEPISDARKQRWLTMMVDYKDLPDNIQEYDREWARKVLAITHPAPSWQGLTDDEIDALEHNDFTCWGRDDLIVFGRAIEQALKEKNDA